jgi:hypothetical protein
MSAAAGEWHVLEFDEAWERMRKVDRGVWGVLRNAAARYLQPRVSPGGDIGSSDINHTVCYFIRMGWVRVAEDGRLEGIDIDALTGA